MATTWEALKQGRSGTGPITKFDASKFPVRFAAEVKGFDPLQYMDRKEAKRADHYTQYAVAASFPAMHDAKLIDTPVADPDRIGVMLGSGIGGLKSLEEQHEVYRERGTGQKGPKRQARWASPWKVRGRTMRDRRRSTAANGKGAGQSPQADNCERTASMRDRFRFNV